MKIRENSRIQPRLWQQIRLIIPNSKAKILSKSDETDGVSCKICENSFIYLGFSRGFGNRCVSPCTCYLAKSYRNRTNLKRFRAKTTRHPAGPGEQAPSSFDGETPSPLPRGHLPPRFSSQVLFIRSHLTMTARQSAETTQHNNNTMALPKGPGPTIAPREFPLILSGIPLSLTLTP